MPFDIRRIRSGRCSCILWCCDAYRVCRGYRIRNDGPNNPYRPSDDCCFNFECNRCSAAALHVRQHHCHQEVAISTGSVAVQFGHVQYFRGTFHGSRSKIHLAEHQLFGSQEYPQSKNCASFVIISGFQGFFFSRLSPLEK